jgi:biopolymer transport protein ExbB
LDNIRKDYSQKINIYNGTICKFRNGFLYFWPNLIHEYSTSLVMSEIAGVSKTANQSRGSSLKNVFAGLMIALCFLVGYIIYYGVLGSSSNFEGGDSEKGHHLNTLGLVYKGGFLVGSAIAIVLMLITFSIERFITLSRANGAGSMDAFVHKIQSYLRTDNIDAAIAECDKQKGAVGNVVRAALEKYKIESNAYHSGEGGEVKDKDKDQRLQSIQKALEEATALELPMLQKHLVIIATIVSVATLLGLMGTVLGMIRAFSALATSGAPDSVALASGISEALINTFIGITCSAVATVVYNYFTNQIDGMTYRIDEAGFSIVQTFAEKHK